MITEGKIKVIIFTNLRRKSSSKRQKSGENAFAEDKVIISVRSQSHHLSRTTHSTRSSELIQIKTQGKIQKNVKSGREKEERCYRNQRKKLDHKYVKKKEVEDVTMDIFFVCVCVCVCMKRACVRVYVWCSI